MASPSHPSATGTEPVTRPDAVSMTETEGGRYPPLSTRRYLPSGESAVDMGRVSSASWRPTGSRRQPLLSRKAPPGSGPTCSRGEGWEVRMAARERKAMARAMRYFSEPGWRVMGTSHCNGKRGGAVRRKVQRAAGGLGLGSGSDRVSGWIWFGLGGKMGSFGVSCIGWPERGGLGWMDERFMPAPL